MKSKTLLVNLMAAAIASSSTIALADNLKGAYVGAGGAIIDANVDDANGDPVSFPSIEAYAGYKLASWAGVEFRVGTGIAEETIEQADGEESSVKIDHYESIYYRPEISNPVAKLYGLFGFTNLQVSSKTSENKVSESGLSYGAGIGFTMNESMNLNFEYRQLLDKEDNQFPLFAISIDWRLN